MTVPERFQPGELLSAARLNDVIDFSRGQYAQVPSNDFDVFNGQNANGRAQKRFERIMLVRAREDFSVRITNCSVEDDIPAGRVDMPRIIPQVNAYEVPTSIRPDWVYDPVAGLSGLPTVREGDYFHAVFNEDSGRWEKLSAPSTAIVTGVVTVCLGDGWHEVELTDWTGEPGSLSESVSGSVSDEEECNVCNLLPEEFGYESISDSVSDGAIDQSTCESVDSIYVPRSEGVLTGETVYAHTARLMPMLIGGMVKMIKRSSSSSSGSASASDALISDRLYDVVDGTWPLVALPFPTYECCVDPDTGASEIRLTACRKVIVEGYACDGPESPCPQGTASGSESV